MGLTRISGDVIQTPLNVGVVTATIINVGSAVTIHTGGFQVGSSDLHSSGLTVQNLNSTGVVTATSFVGNISGNVTGNATGLSGTPNITVGSITASSATITGNVSVAGTVTYEDITNVDSIGIITARSGIHVTDGSVGIGTNSPAQKLDVFGLTRITQNNNGQNGLVVSMPTGVENTASGIRVQGYSPAIELLDKDSVQNWYIAIDDNVTNNFQIARGYGPGQGINGVIEITPSDNVGIGITNPSNKLVVNGYMQTPNSSSGAVGLEIGYRKLVSITGNYSANTWYNTGIDRTTDTGIYLLNAWIDTYNAGGQSYQTNYVGWFVMPNRASNANQTSSITLHSAGHAPNAEVIQFRTLLTFGGDSKIYLQWLSNFNLNNLDNSSGRSIQVAIHRFATALNNG